MTIHWCGTGLSAIPGLRRLIEDGHDVAIWNRTVEKASEAVGDLTDRIAVFDPDALSASLASGDVIVSMLPGDWHVPLAKAAITAGAGFVSSSYIASDMRELDALAKQAGVPVVNEVGLDPGIDHLMAHWLVADYRGSPAYDPTNAVSFLSYCGGVPKEPNAFRYKFSWSPAGVLRALRSPSRSIRDYSELQVARPWDALQRYDAPLSPAETFEVYPNRDSLPFMAEYGFDPVWPVRNFVRGTLRLNGWSEAWAGIFDAIEKMDGPDGEAQLASLSNTLWAEHTYEPGEPDRVILCVDLKAESGGWPAYHKTYVMDAWGDARGSAMARLVSMPVSFAAEAIIRREIGPGVHAAPSDPKLVLRWLGEIEHLAQRLFVVDNTAG
jgi:saccharopine dehydrogenase (NADP+, L-glutamate forming)